MLLAVHSDTMHMMELCVKPLALPNYPITLAITATAPAQLTKEASDLFRQGERSDKDC